MNKQHWKYGSTNGCATASYKANISSHPIDTFSDLTLLNPSGTAANNITYSFPSTGIAWPDDKTRFKQPAYQPNEALPPPNWALRYPNGQYTDEYPPPDFSLDEHFQVWMRTSWYPTFRKLWGKNTQLAMEPGRYQMELDMSK